MDPGHRVTLIAALIGVIGTLGAAVIANWDKLAGLTPDAGPSISPATAVRGVDIQIGGEWRDVNIPSNGSRVIQNGSTYRFQAWGLTLHGVRYESSGQGSLSGDQVSSEYVARFENGMSSQGSCSGSVSSDGRRMTTTCTDSLLGTFVSTARRP